MTFLIEKIRAQKIKREGEGWREGERKRRVYEYTCVYVCEYVSSENDIYIYISNNICKCT